MRFEGIYTPLVTPYHDDFSVNETALEETVEHLADHRKTRQAAPPSPQHLAQTAKQASPVHTAAFQAAAPPKRAL